MGLTITFLKLVYSCNVERNVKKKQKNVYEIFLPLIKFSFYQIKKIDKMFYKQWKNKSH